MLAKWQPALPAAVTNRNLVDQDLGSERLDRNAHLWAKRPDRDLRPVRLSLDHGHGGRCRAELPFAHEQQVLARL